MSEDRVKVVITNLKPIIWRQTLACPNTAIILLRVSRFVMSKFTRNIWGQGWLVSADCCNFSFFPIASNFIVPWKTKVYILLNQKRHKLIDPSLAPAIKLLFMLFAFGPPKKPIEEAFTPGLILVAYHEKMHLFYNKGAKQLATSGSCDQIRPIVNVKKSFPRNKKWRAK